MLEIALNNQDYFKISYIENNDKKNNYAIDYVFYFKNLYPKKINLVIGFDSFLDITNWYKYEDLLANTDLYVINRPGKNKNKLSSSLNLYKKNIHFIENIYVDISVRK